MCLCGARSRAHKKEYPLNSRNRYVGCTLFPKASSVDSDKVDSCVKSELPKTSKVGTRSTQLGKRENPVSEKPPPAKKTRPKFRVGDCVNLHDSELGKCHLPCFLIVFAVQMFGDRRLLCCCKGVLKTGYAKSQLTDYVRNLRA